MAEREGTALEQSTEPTRSMGCRAEWICVTLLLLEKKNCFMSICLFQFIYVFFTPACAHINIITNPAHSHAILYVT